MAGLLFWELEKHVEVRAEGAERRFLSEGKGRGRFV